MSFRKLKALVIEDEAPIRNELVSALHETLEFEVAGSADSVEDGFELVQKEAADVLFMDIQLIGGTAFQLLTHLKRAQVSIPPVVINTGFREFEYAQKIHNDFREEVIYILKKPFWEEWKLHQEKITEALYLRMQQERRSGTGSSKKMLSIQDGRQSYLVNPVDIIRVKTGAKSQGKTECFLQYQTLGCNLSLTQLMALLSHDFIQVNRFEAINGHWITMIDHTNREVHLRNGDSVLIGNAYYTGLTEWMEE